MTKIFELVGTDYYACSNDHVVLAPGMDIEVEREAYGNRWNAVPIRYYESFCEFLISRGARKPMEDEFQSVEE